MALKFNFRLLTHSPERINVQSAKLGATSAEKFASVDVGKPMKKGTKGNFVICTAGDEIEGFLDTVDAGGTTDGFAFGGVAAGNRGFRTKVTVARDTADIAVLGYVVAGTNAAAGTGNTGDLGIVTQSNDGAGDTKTNWRIVSLAGDVETSAAATIEAVIELQ